MEEAPVLLNTVTIESSKISNEENHENDKRSSPNESEYDSAGSYSEEGDYHEKNNESIERTELDGEEKDTLEREEGDGQESTPQKKVDDDEDKKNPQYIPKRGTFYEHDDRTADDELAAEAEKQEKQEKDGKKKLWQDKKERWSHDKFNDHDQAPKSKVELVQIYGYDIRNEDCPPKPRRRRRYGRGPNKYTRDWKDEDAYGKPVPPRNPKQTKNPPENDEFPPLEHEDRKNRDQVGTSRDAHNVSKARTNNNRRSENREEFHQRSQPEATNRNHDSGPSASENSNAKIGSGRVSKQIFESRNNAIRDSDYRGFTKVSMGKNLKNSSRPHRKDNYFIHSQNFSSRKHNSNIELEDSMSNLNIDSRNNKGNNQRQSIPPRMQQAEQKGSKRYSSIRQRSLPETNNAPIIPPHSNYYGNDLNQTQASNGAPPPPSVIHLQAPGGVPPQVPPVTAVPPILQAPPPQQFAPPFPPQAPTYLQASVPPTFLPQQAPPLLNYVPAQPQFPPGGGYQGFQAPFNTVAPSTELYQPQGGITYYSTDQQVTQRPVPQKRPKAAIPIVAPPNFDAKNMKPDEETYLEYPVETNNSVG